MATISHNRIPTNNSRAFIARWVGLTPGDTGEPVPFSQYTDRSVQVVGTFGGAAVVIEGSNDDGTTWSTLTDPQGNDLNITGAKIELVTEATQWVRPRVAGGTGTSVSVHLLCKE